MKDKQISNMTAVEGPSQCAQPYLPASTKPSHRDGSYGRISSLGQRKYEKRKHSLRYLLIMLLFLISAVASRDFWVSYFNDTVVPRALWGWMPSQTSIIVHGPENFDWEAIAPSVDLSYYPCYEAFECARLEVPLDWNNQSTDSRRVAVALIKLPSKVPTSDPRYGGSIIINPGGPGGSGINFARSYGRHLQTIADSPLSPGDTRSNDISNKYFDILSFDPRGVGYTTPAFICFPDATQRMNWNIASDAEGLLGSSSVAFELMWARKHALADACYSRLAVDESGNSGLGAYMNTPVVAMDMKAIVEALSRSSTGSLDRCPNTQSSKTGFADKIQYWGFSYGTLLGETFAAMYPDLVDRMVLDGVVDADRHYAGTWDGNLEDADAIMKKFSDYCFEAGLERCALYSDKGPQRIQDHLDNIIASIADTPISVSISDIRGPAVITHSDVKGAVREALYSPFESFENLARIMHDISQGNGTRLADSKATEYRWQDLTPKCRSQGPYSPHCFSPPVDYAEEVVGAIACSDGPDQTNMTAAEFLKYWQRVRRESVYLGDRWARNRLMCVFWRFRPRVTYPGSIEGLTSKSILFVSNTLDPVTSLANGQKMSRRFNGSRLLQQDSIGHVSLSTPSICSARIVREYFQTGTLPGFGRICSVYERPFGLPGNRCSVTVEPGDDVLLESLRAIASHMW